MQAKDLSLQYNSVTAEPEKVIPTPAADLLDENIDAQPDAAPMVEAAEPQQSKEQPDASPPKRNAWGIAVGITVTTISTLLLIATALGNNHHVRTQSSQPTTATSHTAQSSRPRYTYN